VRVTDHKGMPVISSCWSEFLEPNVTVIVDTCAYIPPSTPAINKALPFPPTTGYGNHRSLSGRRGRSRGSIKRSRRELDTVTLAGRESEDSAYEAACVLSPLGQIGQCAYFSPPNPLKSRPQGGAWDGWNAEEKRRETSVNMFVSGRAPPRNVQPVSPGGSQITNKPLQAHESPKIPFQGMGWSGSGMKRTATAGSNSGAFQHKKRKSVWSKITSAFIHIFSGGSSADRNSNNFSCRGRGDPFQEDRFPENRQREHILSQALSQAPDSMSASLGRRRPASAGPPSKDSVLPPLTLPPRMMHPNSLPFGFSTSLQRSKSLSYFPELDLSKSSPLRSLSQRTARHNPDLRKSPSPKLKPQIPPASSEPLRRRNISPPVPQRPTGSFGFNPQYEKPTTIHMAQIMEIASDQQDDGRCRTGSADTDKTLVDFPQVSSKLLNVSLTLILTSLEETPSNDSPYVSIARSSASFTCFAGSRPTPAYNYPTDRTNFVIWQKVCVRQHVMDKWYSLVRWLSIYSTYHRRFF